MAGQSCAKVLAGPMRLFFVERAGKNGILLIAWIGRDSHGCGDVGKGAIGGVSRQIETMD